MWTRIQAACVLNYLVTVHGSVNFTRALSNNNGEHPRVFSQERTTVVGFQNNLHYSNITVTETIQTYWCFSRDWTNYCSNGVRSCRSAPCNICLSSTAWLFTHLGAFEGPRGPETSLYL